MEGRSKLIFICIHYPNGQWPLVESFIIWFFWEILWFYIKNNYIELYVICVSNEQLKWIETKNNPIFLCTHGMDSDSKEC